MLSILIDVDADFSVFCFLKDSFREGSGACGGAVIGGITCAGRGAGAGTGTDTGPGASINAGGAGSAGAALGSGLGSKAAFSFFTLSFVYWVTSVRNLSVCLNRMMP